MIKKTIEYTNYNGEKVKEDLYFNLSKAEIMEYELGFAGGMSKHLTEIIEAENVAELVALFKNLLLLSYGIKSSDGRTFLKKDIDGRPLSIGFSQTEAYSELFMELATNSDLASEFVNGIMPVMDTPSSNKIEVSATN